MSSRVGVSFAEATPARVQAKRVAIEPATEDAAAILRNLTLRSLLAPSESRRKTSGNGPESNPPMRVSQPLRPDFSGFTAGFLRSSIEAPTTLSATEVAMLTALSAGEPRTVSQLSCGQLVQGPRGRLCATEAA